MFTLALHLLSSGTLSYSRAALYDISVIKINDIRLYIVKCEEQIVIYGIVSVLVMIEYMLVVKIVQTVTGKHQYHTHVYGIEQKQSDYFQYFQKFIHMSLSLLSEKQSVINEVNEQESGKCQSEYPVYFIISLACLPAL